MLVELRGAVGARDGLVASAAASVIGARRACWLCAAALGTARGLGRAARGGLTVRPGVHLLEVGFPESKIKLGVLVVVG